MDLQQDQTAYPIGYWLQELFSNTNIYIGTDDIENRFPNRATLHHILFEYEGIYKVKSRRLTVSSLSSALLMGTEFKPGNKNKKVRRTYRFPLRDLYFWILKQEQEYGYTTGEFPNKIPDHVIETTLQELRKWVSTLH